MSGAEVAIGVIGVGTIGGYWLDHFAPTLPLQSRARVTAIFRRQQQWLAPRGIASKHWRETFTQHAQARQADGVEQWLQATRQREQQPVVLDLTADKTISRRYPAWFASGAHIISANKYAGSSAWSFYQELQRVRRQYQRHWLYNTTVGAGLPILSALHERCLCGDQVQRVEGNLSGSLSWIFQQYRAGDKLSDWVLKAQKMGLTEPDPRLDLGGMDVARKLVILAREVGWKLQLKDINMQNLVPDTLQAVSATNFVARLDDFDQAFDAWRQREHPNAEQFVYLGFVARDGAGQASGGTRLQPIDDSSLYARLPAGNANFTVQSRQYDANPLVIQGPGAGPEVTAAGVHSDVLQLIARLKNN